VSLPRSAAASAAYHVLASLSNVLYMARRADCGGLYQCCSGSVAGGQVPGDAH